MNPITKVTFHFTDGTTSRLICTPDYQELTVDSHDGYHKVSAGGKCIASALSELVKWYETDQVAP